MSDFIARHIGLDSQDIASILSTLGVKSIDDFMQDVVPAAIAHHASLDLPDGMDEHRALAHLRSILAQNHIHKTYIGQGYYYSHTPKVILRNILENPAWYTAYTPYQPEISQGRLEAIMNFQHMLVDLTGMDIANASMLDEGSACAEAVMMLFRNEPDLPRHIFVDQEVFPQTIEVLQTRAQALGITLEIGVAQDVHTHPEKYGISAMGVVVVQYPYANGQVMDYSSLSTYLKLHGKKMVCASDLLALTLLTPPGEWGADAVVGNSQRFGVPVGFGGPHAAFLATKDAYKRAMPGRLVGMSIDSKQRPAYRLALQTREQHIRREKATSNICTAQVLLAVMASMYAVYHGPQGLKKIAQTLHRKTQYLAAQLTQHGVRVLHQDFFDTLCIEVADAKAILHKAQAQQINFRWINEHHLGISLDETTEYTDIAAILAVFDIQALHMPDDMIKNDTNFAIPNALQRTSTFLTHEVFQRYHTEHEMLRYLRQLADKDLALDRTMIPLGSCTMKLNATSEMIPVTWPEVGNIHPFAPKNQTLGYQQMIAELEHALAICTGYDAVSIQPNAGSQGEYAGLLIIQKYHQSRGEGHRHICLIPTSAHGTNPASASMVGMDIVMVQCDAQGNVDMQDLQQKVTQHSANLAALMVTYPSTHGVFEENIRDICALIHQHGGQVYIDGANMNALVGTALPGVFGGDVSHLNLHKTFCIPHGGGGPGVGPVAVAAHLTPFLPNHRTGELTRHAQGIAAITSAPYGSASILPISWMYIRMMGAQGLAHASKVAILAANYIAHQLQAFYPILYVGQKGRVAHECILDIRPLQKISGVSNEDIAKRLMDYGFHAPTMSFPVPGTLMIEPTESESLAELNRFIDAMVCIREEIEMIIQGTWSMDNNPLKNAPHTAYDILADAWPHAYTRQQAAYGIHADGISAKQQAKKYWPPVSRIDNVHGDRYLCACLVSE